jgi:two-component system phosphate regulon sensor histidine kinase PhoR
MGKHYSLSTRILLSIWIVLLPALLLPPWYYYRILTQEVLDEAKRNAVQQLNLLHWMLNGESTLQDITSLQAWLGEAKMEPECRITYVAEGGKVVADSEVPLSEIPSLDNHSDRAEIIEAQGGQVGAAVRYSRTSQKDLIYVARRVEAKGAIPAGVLRLAAPLSSATGPLERLKNSLILFAVLIFGATALLTYALIRRINRPVLAMIEAANAISTRDYRRRIRFSPGHEFEPLIDSINRMAESIEKHIQTITGQQQQLEGVFNAMQEAVMVLDRNGRIESVNRAFSDLLSSGNDVLGRRPLEVMVNVELQKLCDRILTSDAGDRAERLSSLQISLGNDRTYDVNIVRLPAQQEEMGAVVVLHDITGLKRLERVRQDFVANVSHELRTPLTSIKGYTETLLAEQEPTFERVSNFLQVILRNTNHMVRIVEDLLQLARLEAHQEGTKPAPINASGAVATAWKACAHQARAKGLRLQNELPEDGAWVLADFDQLVQVFRNLIENAIRYSPDGEAVTVSCELRENRMVFHVRDEGPGIPKQHQERIFERFYRIETHRGDRWGSTGLGLAICRHIIRNHGGSIWVESPNRGSLKGSTFSFTIPGAAGQRQDTRDLAEPADKPSEQEEKERDS